MKNAILLLTGLAFSLSTRHGASAIQAGDASTNLTGGAAPVISATPGLKEVETNLLLTSQHLNHRTWQRVSTTADPVTGALITRPPTFIFYKIRYNL